LLTRRLNSASANYEASTKTVQIHKNETLERQNQNSMTAAAKINNMNYVMRKKPLTLKKT